MLQKTVKFTHKQRKTKRYTNYTPEPKKEITMNITAQTCPTTTAYQTIAFLIFLTFCFLGYVDQARAGHYEGHGISFTYPDSYVLANKANGINLKNGPNTIGIDVAGFVFPQGFEDAVIASSKKKMAGKGIIVKGTQKEEKIIPLKVKNQFGQIYVNAFKYILTGEMTRKGMLIPFTQTLFFFSYADHGYIISFSRMQAKYSDLVTVLSSFTFDKAEHEGTTDNSNLY